MDIYALEAFRVIAETGSLTRSAERLHVSQPAMSAALKKFEAELGAQLFDREANRIRLNAAGELALERVNAVLRAVEKLREDVRRAAGQGQTLCIAFCDPGVRWFSAPRFAVARPDIDVRDDLYEGMDAARLLKERVYDLMVTPAPLADGRILSRPFLRDRVFLSVPEDSPLAQKRSLSLRDIPAQPFLYPQIGGYFLTRMEQIIAGEGLPITLVKNNYNVTQHLIRTTNFLAAISTLSSDLRNDGEHRVRIPLTDPELNVLYYLSFLKAEREKVRPFLQWAKACEAPE